MGAGARRRGRDPLENVEYSFLGYTQMRASPLLVFPLSFFFEGLGSEGAAMTAGRRMAWRRSAGWGGTLILVPKGNPC